MISTGNLGPNFDPLSWRGIGQFRLNSLGDFLVIQIAVQGIESRVAAQIQQAGLSPLVSSLQETKRIFSPAEQCAGCSQIISGSNTTVGHFLLHREYGFAHGT